MIICIWLFYNIFHSAKTWIFVAGLAGHSSDDFFLCLGQWAIGRSTQRRCVYCVVSYFFSLNLMFNFINRALQ